MGKKSGFVSIIGKPNAGKSTLMNAVLGQSLSIVTPKPQTTRNKVFGIYTKGDVQIVFVDTPGILTPKYKLQEFMVRELESSFEECDVIVLMYDASEFDIEDFSDLVGKYAKDIQSKKSFLVLNKIDEISKEQLLLIINETSRRFSFDEIIPVSAKKKFGIQEFIGTIVKYLPENEFFFEKDMVAAQPEKFFVSEIIRERALKLYRDEIPFSIFVNIEEFKQRDRGKDLIRASIIVEKETQKGIVIGARGALLKKLGELSRKEIEEFLGRKVYLELFVKVKKNWKSDEKFLKTNFTKQSAFSEN